MNDQNPKRPLTPDDVLALLEAAIQAALNNRALCIAVESESTAQLTYIAGVVDALLMWSEMRGFNRALMVALLLQVVRGMNDELNPPTE